MGKTIRHNRNGEPYQDKDSAGYGFCTNIKDNFGVTIYKRNKKRYCTLKNIMLRRCVVGGYAYERDAKSDRNGAVKHLAKKALRRKTQRETTKIIESSYN